MLTFLQAAKLTNTSLKVSKSKRTSKFYLYLKYFRDVRKVPYQRNSGEMEHLFCCPLLHMRRLKLFLKNSLSDIQFILCFDVF